MTVMHVCLVVSDTFVVIFIGWCAVSSNVFMFTKERMQYYKEKVKRIFLHAYDSYIQYAFPFDELKPISCAGMNSWGSFSLSLIDSLDTLIIMGNYSEFRRVANIIIDGFDSCADVNVSVFETNIRVIGGLLSAHILSKTANMELEDGWPCQGPLLRLAESVASKLLPAFKTTTGMPYGTVNLRHGVCENETSITCTAGIGTFLLEFGTLSRLTGNYTYERAALNALQQLWNHKSSIGLVGNHIDVQTSMWTATDAGIGGGVDSYFEYLVKGGALINSESLLKHFNEYRKVIDKYMNHQDWFPWVSMYSGQLSLAVFQSLEAFWPGLLTLIGDVGAARRIMLNYDLILSQYGMTPEFYSIHKMEADKRSGYPLRPEVAESLMYLYRETEDPMLLRMGASIIEAIESSSKTTCGYATVYNVADHSIEDRMESFFLAETTKYLYMLFDPDNAIHDISGEKFVIYGPHGKCVINSGGYIFNTEAHPVDSSINSCCASTRLEDIKQFVDFQDNLDLLAIAESELKFGQLEEEKNYESCLANKGEAVNEKKLTKMKCNSVTSKPNCRISSTLISDNNLRVERKSQMKKNYENLRRTILNGIVEEDVFATVWIGKLLPRGSLFRRLHVLKRTCFNSCMVNKAVYEDKLNTAFFTIYRHEKFFKLFNSEVNDHFRNYDHLHNILFIDNKNQKCMAKSVGVKPIMGNVDEYASNMHSSSFIEKDFYSVFSLPPLQQCKIQNYNNCFSGTLSEKKLPAKFSTKHDKKVSYLTCHWMSTVTNLIGKKLYPFLKHMQICSKRFQFEFSALLSEKNTLNTCPALPFLSRFALYGEVMS
ncbi:ER degradation-enhancing alpha-mannosidase-like protein 2 [Trichinella murrelli]|uniref:alpha-1,2-Mannosidase n=1 Tax=Trichinella murrelli TaxID=144512 RepID=A0A0V0U1K8_9BILA|nr:ER degradation-enhancing alpha-mannosidase-like protein 2 [Trichinella murrelli]